MMWLLWRLRGVDGLRKLPESDLIQTSSKVTCKLSSDYLASSKACTLKANDSVTIQIERV